MERVLESLRLSAESQRALISILAAKVRGGPMPAIGMREYDELKDRRLLNRSGVATLAWRVAFEIQTVFLNTCHTRIAEFEEMVTDLKIQLRDTENEAIALGAKVIEDEQEGA